MKIEVFTDGGAHNNDGPDKGIGGWGVVIMPEGHDMIKLSGGERDTTNNRMELIALQRALEYIISNGWKNEEITIQSDSQYTMNTVKSWMYSWAKKNWMTSDFKPVKNLDIVQDLYELYPQVNVIDYKWIKGHKGYKYNEICDNLATIEQQKLMGKPVDERTQEILEADTTYALLSALTKQEVIKYVMKHGFVVNE